MERVRIFRKTEKGDLAPGSKSGLGDIARVREYASEYAKVREYAREYARENV